jgi:chemotaxis protein methyltransferase CheR
MNENEWVRFLQRVLPQLGMRWPGFRRVRRQVIKRIKHRISELGLPDIDAYEALLESAPEEWSRLDTFCRITISRFYRDRGVIDFLRDRLLPALVSRHGEQLRCWSAGCASGEEPYTLAMIGRYSLRARFPGLTMRILGTDVDEGMLRRAHDAAYAPSSLKDLPARWRTCAFVPAGRRLLLRPELKVGVEFRLQDIRRALPDDKFQLILCRNLVFTYYDEPLQRELLGRLLDNLADGGALVIGSRERLPSGFPGLLPLAEELGIHGKGAWKAGSV